MSGPGLSRARLAQGLVSDDITEAWGHSLGLRVFRGDDENVLSRFTAIIRERDPSWIVRVTGDNPFVSGEVVDLLLEAGASWAGITR